MDALINNLNKLAHDLRLVPNAIKGAKLWAASEDFDIDNSITCKFKYDFDSHKLCFESEDMNVPYLETTLNIRLEDDVIGYYCWHSLLNGEVIDDMLVITNHELKYS
ncbi:hypothetical protein H4J53_20085 [Colwellia sp. BRX8-3]|jgi:hypothetical protein|nr:hypothetical protein [Colwellia sp. BRX8-3]MBA6362098.1 hypothetical protein [Colwellia sp. BRX8-6]MBA6369786.1 hypothetical protein [Colwellia sp. BRX8-5]MBA6377517.1 hypothetical protein [Colwellia sp. BRX8-2]